MTAGPLGLGTRAPLGAGKAEDLIKVEQRDRDAAVEFYAGYLARPGEVPVAATMRAGGIDESPLIQAFARHRIVTLEALAQDVWPDELTPELADILGRPCFMFIRLSQVFRVAGFDIAKSAEAEQAFFLHRFLGHWFRHGDKWREAAQADLREVHERVAALAVDTPSEQSQ